MLDYGLWKKLMKEWKIDVHNIHNIAAYHRSNAAVNVHLFTCSLVHLFMKHEYVSFMVFPFFIINIYPETSIHLNIVDCGSNQNRMNENTQHKNRETMCATWIFNIENFPRRSSFFHVPYSIIIITRKQCWFYNGDGCVHFVEPSLTFGKSVSGVCSSYACVFEFLHFAIHCSMRTFYFKLFFFLRHFSSSLSSFFFQFFTWSFSFPTCWFCCKSNPIACYLFAPNTDCETDNKKTYYICI